jgi:hypothetical protein
MPPRTVSQLDLANLKADITEEQMRIRHEQRAEFATKLLIVDTLSVEQKLTNQTIQTMQKTLDTHQEYTKGEFEALRKDMKESNQSIHSKLDQFIETANKTFVKTTELDPIKKKQEEHDKIFSTV